MASSSRPETSNSKSSRRKEKPVRLFEDLNHRSRKIFDDEYNFDKLKVELRKKYSPVYEFSVGGVYTPGTDKLLGIFGTKYTFKDYGLCFSEKYNTDGVWMVELQSSPKNYLKGAKFTAESTLIPTNRKSLKVKAEYRKPVMSLSANADFERTAPRITLAGVVQRYGWFIGSQFKYDLKNSKLKNHNVAVGYTADDFMFHTNVSDGKVFTSSISQKINDSFETGVELGWSMVNNKTKIGIGCKYALNCDTSIRAKVNHSNEIGLCYSQKLTDGVAISLSTLINGRNSHPGAHNVGMGITIER